MPDWTCCEGFWRSYHYGESKDDALAPDHGLSPTCEQCEEALATVEIAGRLLCRACQETTPEDLAQQVIDAAFDEAAGNGTDFDLDYTARGERILRQHIAAAIRAARRAA